MSCNSMHLQMEASIERDSAVERDTDVGSCKLRNIPFQVGVERDPALERGINIVMMTHDKCTAFALFLQRQF